MGCNVIIVWAFVVGVRLVFVAPVHVCVSARKSRAIASAPRIFKFVAMTHIRAAQLQQIACFCELYCAAKQDGCTVREKYKTRKRWGVKLKNAMQYEALLEESGTLHDGTMDPERVEEVLLQLIMHQRAQPTPVDEPPAELSFVERLADAMVELRNNRNKRGITVSLEKKYNVRRKNFWRYSQELRFELERDPPLADEVFRELVLRKAAERGQNQCAHKRYFDGIEEQMLVGALMGHDRTSQPLDPRDFCAIVRDMLLVKFQDDPKRLREVQNTDLQNWLRGFKKRHEAQLANRKTQHFSVERAMAQDSALLDAWFAAVARFERQWIQKGLLPSTGMEPFQVLNYDESGLEPMGKQRYALVERSNRQCNRVSSADRSAFHVTVGCVTSAAGDVISTQVIHSQPNRRLTEGLAEGLLPESDDLTGATEEQPEADVEIEVDPDIFLSATANAWQDDISFHAFMQHMAIVLDGYRTKLGCPLDTPMFLFVDNHYSRCKDLERTKEIVELCTSKAIEVIFLPPHLSQCTQPNDCGLHSHLKAVYTRKLSEDLNRQIQQGRRSRLQKLRKVDFNRVFRETIQTISSQPRSREIIRNGFKKSGLLPIAGSSGFEAPLLPQWYLPPEEREPLSNDFSDEKLENPTGPEDELSDDGENTLAQFRTPSRPTVPNEEATEHDGPTFTDSDAEDKRLSELRRKKRRKQEELYEICQEERQLLSQKRRRSEGSASLVRDAGLLMTTPEVVRERLRRLTQQDLTRQTLNKRAKTTLVLDEEGNASVTSLKERFDNQVALAAKKAREQRQKRIDNYRKRTAFIVFCAEQNIDLNRAGAEQVVELTHEFDAYTSDKDALERLKEQWKWCQHNRKAREKLEKLMKRPAFIVFCYHVHQKPPEDIEETHLFQAMHDYCTKTPPVTIPERAPVIPKPAPEPEPEPAPRNSRYGRRIKARREISI